MDSGRTARIVSRYRRWGMITIGAVLFLILVGGIVRSSGAGMGCPDWPKCFGLWVPPSQVDQIPKDYFEKYPEAVNHPFNPVKTWTEYVNRLVGATIGIFVFITAIFSLSLHKLDKRITYLSFATLILTGFQGWLGKVVVDKELSTGMVTIHMLTAMLILMCLILSVYLAKNISSINSTKTKYSTSTNIFGIIALVFTTAQILIGTQVREKVDEVGMAMGGTSRDTWTSHLGTYFSIHKVFYLLVAAIVVIWAVKLISENNQPATRFFAYAMIGLLFFEVLLGIILSRYALPPVIQPVHMLIANLLFASEFLLLIKGLQLENFGRSSKQYIGMKTEAGSA